MTNKSTMFFKGFWVHPQAGGNYVSLCKEIAETGAEKVWGLVEHLSRGDIDRFIDAVHNAGLEFHAWMVNNCAGEQIKKGLADKKNWAVVSREGKNTLEKPLWGGQTWCCPTSPDFRAFQLERIHKWLDNSEADGLHFDYIRYPDTYRYEGRRVYERTEVPEYSFCYCNRCRKLFREEKGYDPMEVALVEGSPRLEEWRKWRQAQITKEVREIRQHVDSKFVLSAAVFPTPEIARKCVLQNWPDFADQLDHVCTMIYTPGQWGHPITWVKEATQLGLTELHGKCKYYAGFGSPIKEAPPGYLRQGIISAKEGGADGAIIFSYPAVSKKQLLEIRKANEEVS